MSDQPTHVVIFSYPNPDIMSFAVNHEICAVYRKGFHRPLREDGQSWNEVGEHAQHLLATLFDVDGVLEVKLTPYEVTVTKGSAFRWDAMRTYHPSSITRSIKDIVGHALVELFGQGISFEEQGPRVYAHK